MRKNKTFGVQNGWSRRLNKGDRGALESKVVLVAVVAVVVVVVVVILDYYYSVDIKISSARSTIDCGKGKSENRRWDSELRTGLFCKFDVRAPELLNCR